MGSGGGGSTAVDAFGSIASAAINASAETTSAQSRPATSRTLDAPPSSRMTRRPWLELPRGATTTSNERARSPSVAMRARAVRARTSRVNVAASGQPPYA